jgi:hypothetical protein
VSRLLRINSATTHLHIPVSFIVSHMPHMTAAK